MKSVGGFDRKYPSVVLKRTCSTKKIDHSPFWSYLDVICCYRITENKSLAFVFMRELSEQGNKSLFLIWIAFMMRYATESPPISNHHSNFVLVYEYTAIFKKKFYCRLVKLIKGLLLVYRKFFSQYTVYCAWYMFFGYGKCRIVL